jgi:hypothetical protein
MNRAATILACSSVALLAAATVPVPLAGTKGGLWEISRHGASPTRQCVADPLALAHYEHRAAACSRDFSDETSSQVTVNYRCKGGGFGESRISVLTPRSLRIETQGIAGDGPFKYVFQARRVGNCSGH